MSDSLNEVKAELKCYIQPKKVEVLSRYFKTGKGQYGEGDKFLGIVVPNIRKVSKKYKNLELSKVLELLKSEWHEERMCAALIMVEQYGKRPEIREKIYEAYLENTKYINNWDLVDLTSRDIVGAHIFNNRKLIPKLYDLAKSSYLFDRRIAVIAPFYFIAHGEIEPSMTVINMTLEDEEDLMQKANGWMLREIWGKVDQRVVEDFIKNNYARIPRTTLRYAVEKFEESKRKKFLLGKID